MALYEKRRNMPPYLAEIPYGFKNLWRVFVAKYDLHQKSFLASDVGEIYLNGAPVTLSQLRQLFDYNRDGCSLIQAQGGSGIYVTLTAYDKENAAYHFETLIEQSLDIQGVTSVTGDMVDNANPFVPVVLHDEQKLNVSVYDEDQTRVNKQLAGLEETANVHTSEITDLKKTAITNITVNDEPVSVSNNTANIQIAALTPEQLAEELNKKVDKTVAGENGTIVKAIEDQFNQQTRTLTLEKTLLSLQTGDASFASSSYALADLLGVTALEAMDKELFYFCDDENLASLSGIVTVDIANLYRCNKDGSIYVPATSDAIQIIFGVVVEYSGYNQEERRVIGSIGRVLSATDNELTCTFANLRAYLRYSEYNGYRAGTTVIDTSTCSLFYVKQDVPAPVAESQLIPLTNSLYYQPVQDYSLMPSGSFWGNFESVPSAGKAYLTADARVRMAAMGAGYDEYIAFSGSTIPNEILTDEDWDSSVSLWVTDGLQFTSRSALLDYLSNFPEADRYKISNLGTVITHYEAGGISIAPSFTVGEISAALVDAYQPVPAEAAEGNVAVFDGNRKLIDGGKPLSAFATAAQGAKADTAVQSVTLAPGAEIGALQITVNGNSQTAMVPGLGSAAFSEAGAFATATQGIKADTAVQTAVLASGSANGTLALSVNGEAQPDVPVTGLGTAAYTNATAYATAAQGEKADTAVQSVSISPGTSNGTIQYGVNGGNSTQVKVTGLASAAYSETDAFATAAQGAKADEALQPSDVVDNLSSTQPDRPLSANQGRVLDQLIKSMSATGKPIGGFATYADRYTNTSQFAEDLQPINVNDTIYIAADENHTNMPAQYRVSMISADGTITYAFIRIVPDTARDFTLNPIAQNEIADGAVTSEKIQDGSVDTDDLANGAVTAGKLSGDLQASMTAANNALQSGLMTSGVGAFVSQVSEGADNTLTIEYANAISGVEVSGEGDFVTGASVNGERLTLEKNGTALNAVSVTGTGNVLSGAEVAGTSIRFATDTMLKSISTTGTGNVVTAISPSGVAEKGTAIASVSKTGTGNVLTGVSTEGGSVTISTGTALLSVKESGEGNVVTGLSASNGVLTATKGSVVSSLPAASTSTPGIVQLNNTLTSTSMAQALTAAQGKALSDALAASSAQNVKLTGNQSISGTKTIASHLVVPVKTAIPETPSSTQYATEAQVATRIAKPLTSIQNNIATFDANGGVVDSGVAYTAVNDAKTAASTALNTAQNAIPASQKGIANGVATLDANKRVLSSQLPSWVGDTKPTYTAAEVGAQPKITANGLLKGNGSGTISAAVAGTDYVKTETDPTVPAWAKAANKPTYTAAEVGAQAKITASGILKGTGSAVQKAVAGTDYAVPSQVKTATLSGSGWSNGSQTVAVSGLSASANGTIGLAPTATTEQVQAAASALLMLTAQASSSVTVRAHGTVPSVDIPIQILIVG